MSASTEIPTLILPCAGFGRRAGSPPAKELLPHPQTGAPPDRSRPGYGGKNKWRVIIITRPDKKILMDHVAKNWAAQIDCHFVLAQRTREWPESVLISKDLWGEQIF